MEIFQGRRWEDMEMDCLVNIFGRVGIESLSLDLPFVCKSWYKATLNPLCWQSLIFPEDLEYSRFVHNTSFEWWFCGTQKRELTEAVVKRSQRCAIRLALPDHCSEDELIYVADECPLLKFVALPPGLVLRHQSLFIPSIISKWKNLETLELQSDENLEEIVVQISLHCSNFVRLCITHTTINGDAALAIATLLPNITQLVLRNSELERSDLVTILKGCKKLVHFDISDCIGFESDDAEILQLASHITTFICEGAYVYNYDDDYYDEGPLNSRDFDFYYGSD